MISKDERKLLISFAKNKALYEAVRKMLLQGMIGTDFTNTNWIWTVDDSLSDAAYGKKVKVTKKAIEWINKGFTDISLLEMQPEPPAEVPNEAR